jgi:broad specificity phosphatase PhoE
VLAGRDKTVLLSELGIAQADLLARRLTELQVARVVSSPLPRCRKTIAPFISASGKQIEFDKRFLEMDYGSWSGKKLGLLSRKPLWSTIQRSPSQVRFPDGESFLEMSARANQALMDLLSPGKRICVVSHGDVIKAMVTQLLGLSLDSLQKFAVDPASITTISVSPQRSTLVALNDTSHLAPLMRPKTGRSKNESSKFVLGGGAGRS